MFRRPTRSGVGRLFVNATLIAALIAVAALGYLVSLQQQRLATEARQAQRLAQAAQQAKYQSADFNGWQTAYALDVYRNASENEATRAEFLSAAAKLDADLTTLESLPAPPDVARTVVATRAAFDEFMAVDARVYDLYRSGAPADRRTASDLVLGREIELYRLIAQGCDEAVTLSGSAADADFARLESVGGAIRRFILGLSALAVALAVAGAVLAESRRRATVERARQTERMAALGQLAGGIAHDFNNILSIILNYTSFAAETAGDETREDLGHIRKAAERAVGLTTQLLGFARQDTARTEILDVNAAIAETRTLLARTIGEHIELVAVPSPDPLLIHADTGRIQQVLVNLAVNARDAMPDGGTLVIAATVTDVAENQAGLRPSVRAGRYAVLSVSDTGTGIPPEVVARIFEPFYTTKPKGRGTGLGLATVFEIVAAAGGAISVSSKPNIGTTFRVYLPAVQAPAAPQTAGTAVKEAPRGHGENILVVEDEPALGASIARILDAGGYRTTTAVNGQDAMQRYERERCDLLITDLVMPEMSGPKLAEALHRTNPALPVLYMSGYSDAASACSPGAGADLIEKPFSPQQLLAAVDEALNRVSGGSVRVGSA